MRYQPAPHRFRRALAALLSLLLGLGPLATPAYAGLTPLADEPLNIKNQAKPNIILTVDDSSSMLFDFLPDYVIGKFDPAGTGKAVSDMYCRDGTGAMGARCGDQGSQNDFSSQGKGKYTSPGYIFEQFNAPNTSFAAGFDVSGPGAGCDTSAGAVTAGTYKCSGGIDPGPSPGIATYPAGSIYAGKPFEYWLLWPAPVHNSAFNHLYYNPRLTYDPPVAADATSYPQMNAANTSNWTQVPADPWASPADSPIDCTKQTCVDLTAKVTVGQWCDSDWTLGINPATGNPFASSADGSVQGDPAFCRSNGVVAPASSGAPAADGDYTYPWPSPGAGVTDAKYFYQNDNVLWCDASSPSWPQNGPANVPQTCNGVVTQPQTCNGEQAQTCGGGNVQTCSERPQTCDNVQPQTCNNKTTPQVCQGGSAQNCANINPQTCNGSSTQTCNNVNAQTCNGYTTQSCSNINAQTCNGYTTQTCDNITTVCTPPPPSSCTTTLEPPGCGGPEAPVCTPTTTCPPDTCVTSGKCTVSNATCTAANASSVCTPINGACSKTGAACQPANAAAQCPAQGNCSVSGAACTAANETSVCTPIDGRCSITNAVCQPANQAAQCPPEGRCSISNALCQSDAFCPTTNGTCSQTGVACTVDNAAVKCPASGKCTISNANCQSDAQCPTLGQACSIMGNACVSNANCPDVGKCSVTNANCTSNGQCPTQAGNCSITGLSCTSGAQCPTQAGTCSITSAACTSDAQCPDQNKTCSVTGLSCTSNAQCPTVTGTCSIVGNVCTSDAQCPTQTTPGACSITGLSCTSNAQCPDQPSPSGSAVCSDTMNASVKTLFEDAADPTKGVVCRRNNQDYSGANPISAGRFNYPDATYKTMVTGGSGSFACTPTPRYTGIPRHYWKTEVEWCDKMIAAGGGDKWAGYGTTAGGGSCQEFKDGSHTFPRFYEFGVARGSAEYGDNYTTPAFQRVDLDIANRASASYTHTWVEDPTDVASAVDTVTRTFDQEMTNYANWFAYYRTRIQALKTVASLAFLGKTAGTLNVDDNFRVGFHTLSNRKAALSGKFDPAKFVDIADFDLVSQKPAWANELFGIQIPLGLETPNLDAMIRIGQYYSLGGSAELSGATDPIVLSCQKNWHMLFTDGFTNQKFPTTTVGDQDDTVPIINTPTDIFGKNQLPVNGTKAIPIAGVVPGDPWPAPFREDAVMAANAGKAADAASDYATNYWVTNLRPAMTENVATSGRDPASWPHQNFAAMSLGTQGQLSGTSQGAVETQLASGALQWPRPQPTVNQPDNSAVDDLWHAAINGRGRFVNAQSADELKLGMGQILQDVANQAGARAGAAFQSVAISGSSKFIYRVNFEPNWAARLRKIEIDPVTGDEIPPDKWDAAAQLGLQLTVIPAVKDTPWFTERKIVTVDETGKAVPFLAADIGANQLDSLAPGRPVRAAAVLEYLRGNQNREGTKLGQFRARIGGLLGDIVDSQPVFVGPPRAPYLEANDPGYTVNFRDVAAFQNRPARVYVGGNDGMLHAFDDDTGNEAWAFVPSVLFRPDDTGLGALAYQDGALPPFKHHYYVDATPRISDVNFGGGDTDWHSILVGGLGKGGKAYYALDVSQPSDITSETELAKRVLWQFTNADLGYTYGRAIIAKTRAFGGQWLVIVPSGYNNVTGGGTGEGKVFFLRASDGTLLKTMSTGVGTTTDPSGLAQIAAYQQDFRNQLAEQIYGGDLQGNFWRFDVSDADDSNWSVTQIAQLTDPSGNPQPVTTPPQIEVDIANGIDRWVFVGTGRLLDDLDLTTPAIADQIQTMYAFRDGSVVAPISPWPAILQPRTDMAAVTDAAGLAARPDNGWYDDLPLGQRIVIPVQAALSLVAYVGTSPQTDPCLTGQPATLYAREYGRGKSLLVDAGATVESIFVSEGIVGMSLVTLSGGSGDTESGGFPDLRIAITAGSPGIKTSFIKPVPPPFSQKHRMSWRLLGQ